MGLLNYGKRDEDMRQWRKVRALQGLLAVVAAVLLLGVCALPEIGGRVAEHYPEYAFLRWPTTIFLTVTAFPVFLALWQAQIICRQIRTDCPFSKVSLRGILTVEYCAMSEIPLYAAGCFLLLTQNALHPGILILAALICFAAAAIALFCAVLAALAEKAMALRLDSELTI